MALNYSDRDTLLPKLYPRVTEAIRKYFLYLSGAGLSSQQDYVKANMKHIPSITSEVLPWLASEQDFIDNGTSITDAAIQSRVETVLNNGSYVPQA